MKIYDVCIIGGGAAGLAAAASFHDSRKICLLEKNQSVGKKLKATGGGRCNLTNEACCGKADTLDFFRSLGLETHRDEAGRYYPYSNQASDVVKILSLAMSKKQVHIETGFEAAGAERKDGLFVISDKEGRIVRARHLILATGGKAAPQFGSTGDGYRMAKRFGHQVSKVYPILAGIRCGDFKDIKGVRAKGCVSLYKDGTLIASEAGEIQFTEEGISGICVFDLTLHITSEEGESLENALRRYRIVLDLAPDFTEKELEKRESAFGILTEKLAAKVGIRQMKHWELPVRGIRGWKEAQCTGGGIALSEIRMETMESGIVPGLYLVGELIDMQGPCGGFNLQNAWETGRKAAAAIEMQYEK